MSKSKDETILPDPKAAPKPAKEEEAPVSTAQEPYPTGSPPDPEDAFERMHGYRRDLSDKGEPVPRKTSRED